MEEAEGHLALRPTLPLFLALANGSLPCLEELPCQPEEETYLIQLSPTQPPTPGSPQDSGVSALGEGAQTGLPLVVVAVVCVSAKIALTGSLNPERRRHPANDSRRHQI